MSLDTAFMLMKFGLAFFVFVPVFCLFVLWVQWCCERILS